MSESMRGSVFQAARAGQSGFQFGQGALRHPPRPDIHATDVPEDTAKPAINYFEVLDLSDDSTAETTTQRAGVKLVFARDEERTAI